MDSISVFWLSLNSAADAGTARKAREAARQAVRSRMG
jgi:hypothetical protein